jgi:MFS family permease
VVFDGMNAVVVRVNLNGIYKSLGVSLNAAAKLSALMVLVALVTLLIMSRYADKKGGRKQILVIGLVLISVASALIALPIAMPIPLPWAASTSTFYGVSWGMGLVAQSSFLPLVVPKRFLFVCNVLLMTLSRLGSSLAFGLVGLSLSVFGRYYPALIILGALTLLGAVVASRVLQSEAEMKRVLDEEVAAEKFMARQVHVGD